MLNTYIPGTAQNIKLKLSVHVKEEVEQTKRYYMRSTTTTSTVTTITTNKAKSIKEKFSGNVERYVKLN